MTKKYLIISELYEKEVLNLSSPLKWQDFLESACKNYKCRFDEQVLIFVQKPQATAVLEIEKWNKKFGRWVNKGATGIVVFGDDSKLKHYFDITDTHETRLSRPVPIWEMKDSYEDEVITTLENTFGILENKSNLYQSVLSASKIAVSDNLSDYFSGLKQYIDDSFLFDTSEDYISKSYTNLVLNSVTFMFLSRLGFDARSYFTDEDFSGIRDFNTKDTINALGIATSDIAEMGLLEIAKTVISLDKINSHTFVDNVDKSYTNLERSDYNESNNLQPNRGLQPTEYNNANHRQPNPWEVFITEEVLPTKVQSSDVYKSSDFGDTVKPPIGDRNSIIQDAGNSYNSNDAKTRSDREDESRKPDGMGENHEQHQKFSRGNSSEPVDLQLETNLPSVLEQINTIEKESEISDSFSVSREDIDLVLQLGSSFVDGKFRIYTHFLKHLSTLENINFLKNEYGTGASFPAIPKLNIFEEHSPKGIKISKGSVSSSTFHLSWANAEKKISQLISANRYLSEKELSHYPEYLEKKKALEKRLEISHEFNEIIREFNNTLSSLGESSKSLNTYVLVTCSNNFANKIDKTHVLTMSGDYVLPIMQKAMEDIISENTHLSKRAKNMLEILNNDTLILPEPEPETEYLYHLGDSVYIGASKYEILAFDDREVRLYDNDFPIINQYFSRDEFDRKVQENPSNDHLKVTAEPKEKTIFQRYLDERLKFPDDIIMLEVGEFFEFLGDDAVFLSDILDVAVNSRQIDGQPIKMSGIPNFAKDNNIEKIKKTGRNILVLYRDKESEFVKGDDVKPTEKPPENDVDLEESPLVLGSKISFDGRDYIIEKVSEFDDVTLRDITFEASVGFPIDRIEKVSFVKRMLEKPVSPEFKKPSKIKISTLHPEINEDNRNQFKINNPELGHGSFTEKYNANISAIKLLKELENRFATKDEQEILSNYVGFGGLADVFSEDNSHYHELKSLLDDDEYSSARESTLSAFYTPPIVIDFMYKALENMGFSKGNILEPSCGIGNFIGRLPNSMSSSKIYGVELDTISGKISQHLYQKSNIAISGFEDVNLPDSFFDVAIGNVPFGAFKVVDKRYDKNNFLIHDFFFAKTIDKIRPNGVIAFITSKGTLDKENPAVRKYIASRCDLLGAIRLPDNTFKANAGTEVTSDIIFLQKRENFTDIMPSWVDLGKDENGLTMNQYFIDNPDMIMGEMKEISGRFGPETACLPYENSSLKELLDDALINIHGEITLGDVNEVDEDLSSIQADPSVRNFSYTVVDSKIYFRENSLMLPIEVSKTAESRIKGLVTIRDCVRKLIEYQTEDYPENFIKEEQSKLNSLYNDFTKKYGLISSRANSMAFSTDSSFPLLSSLEILDEHGNLERKADMFTKRTINPRLEITSVDTSSEALALSLSEKACVDLDYMCSLTSKTQEQIESDLEGVIFRVPDKNQVIFQNSDEYLSGNVREKLEIAKIFAETDSAYKVNVDSLLKVQPPLLSASEIAVRLGSVWIPPSDIKDFIFELLETPRYASWNIKVHFSKFTSTWNIEGKNQDRGNVKAHNTYGTHRANAYKIIEESLNLKDIRVFDYAEDADGKRTQVLNKKETAIAQSKQELIKTAFSEWIWKDPERRDRLTHSYNIMFNSIRPREYDGSHLGFSGMNPEISLRQHQKNAIARVLYGGNTLLAHVVGAGKTFTMVASAMELKRLHLCNKSMFVVPNHLTEQTASEFLSLYPSANILVVTNKDFEMKNRKKFSSRVATGEYDAVIIGHSQFEKIPMSVERKCAILNEQISEITNGIAEAKSNRGDKFTVKQMEKTRKTLKVKLNKLNDQSRKDNVINFEELGIDRIFVDESHCFKNLFTYTKMRNVGGISQTDVQKSSDLFMKCRYLDEITGGKGIIFATGTPISNSMVEMFTIQRYLEYSLLKQKNLLHFDAWASTFGETVTAIELAPEGSGYRAKTRFAKFFNLPELMCMFKEVADIQTADMLNLPVPIAHFNNIVVKPSDLQVDMVKDLASRAEKVRNKMVDNSVDNMLTITNDGRKLALDQRLMNELLPDFVDSKVNSCTDNVYKIWEETTPNKSTQLVFCDLSTPKSDGTFSVYNDMRDKLIARGIPPEEIEFIHNANNDVKKKELFSKVRNGSVRILFGSTSKMGAGTNVQKLLIAIHNIDCPWRPSDLEQRAGRIIRQGNSNPEVTVFRYVTEETFDAYMYQLVEGKQKFISQIMTSKFPLRSADDIDATALSYAEIKMLATGNPDVKEKMDLDIVVSKLKLLKQNHLQEKYLLEDRLIKVFPKEIKALEERINSLEKDKITCQNNKPTEEIKFLPMKINGVLYTEKALAGSAILDVCSSMSSPDLIPIGEYRGFKMSLEFDTLAKEYKATLKGELSHKVSLGTDTHGNITRIDNLIDGISDKLETAKEHLESIKIQVHNTEIESKKDFPKEEELKEKSKRLDELNILLNLDKHENEIADDPKDNEDLDVSDNKDMER